MVVGSDGKAEARIVRVSRTIGDKWLVDSGLSAGEKLIVEGLQKVKPGVPVRITATTLTPPPSAAAAAGGAQASDR
jgi:membrane fusion protein (multidrug efflux system)